ncbi:hypothetical protein BHE74_00011829 [Ensete ventricosum]|nr:hypothetical protein BHE74_00011829 [Ensete ventricosum]
MEASQRPVRLRCSVQNYDWGRVGVESTVARLFRQNSGREIELGRPYAEFWMGTHESGPSFVVAAEGSGTEEAVTLKEWTGANPGALGNKVVEKWGNDLPFLFKVVPVLQLISFVPVALSLGFDVVYSLILMLEKFFTKLMTAKQLVLLLEKQYQADVGIIAAFLFNYVKLSPGEALYIGPNEPHAYISGECIECMATSDNVVRAGLTPKYIDKQTLCSMLTYKQSCELVQGFPEILRGSPINPYVSRFRPPFDEFEVDRCLLPSKESVEFSAIPGPSIFVVVAGGEGRMEVSSVAEELKIMEGDVYFVPAQTEIRLSAGADGPIKLFRAGVNSRIFA